MLLEAITLAQILNPKEPELPQPTPQASVKVEPKQETIKKKKKPPQTYRVIKGDSLNKIAKKKKTTVKRLWSFNRNIKHQDNLRVGQKLKIPPKDLKLKPRAFVKPKPIKHTSKARKALRTSVQSSNGLNGYAYPSCTGHVALKRYVPSGWGNAYSWLANARADGYATGSTPRAGAIGWKGNHVVYVEAVHGNTITISENNYDWNGSTRTITVPASKYLYIY